MRIDPVLIRIGPLAVHWYGVLIMIGCMLSATIASRLSRRNGHDPELAWTMLTYAIIGGILGARVWHILTDLEYYFAHPGEMFGLQMSGLRIYGAVFGGMIAVGLFTWRNKLRFWEWADYAAPGLILSQGIGRFGNFINQESYGKPTDLPWGVFIDPARRVPGYEMYERFHPFFFYEAAFNFLIFAVLLYLAIRWVKGRYYGDIFCAYGILYPIARYIVEPLRLDVWVEGGVLMARVVSAAVLVVSVGIMLVHRRGLPGREGSTSGAYVPGTPWEPPAEDAPEASAEPEATEPAD